MPLKKYRSDDPSTGMMLDNTAFDSEVNNKCKRCHPHSSDFTRAPNNLHFELFVFFFLLHTHTHTHTNIQVAQALFKLDFVPTSVVTTCFRGQRGAGTLMRLAHTSPVLWYFTVPLCAHVILHFMVCWHLVVVCSTQWRLKNFGAWGLPEV